MLVNSTILIMKQRSLMARKEKLLEIALRKCKPTILGRTNVYWIARATPCEILALYKVGFTTNKYNRIEYFIEMKLKGESGIYYINFNPRPKLLRMLEKVYNGNQ